MILNSDFKVEEGNSRIDKWLADNLSGWTRSQIKLQIENGGVQINQKTATKAGIIVKPGDQITLSFKQEELSAEPENISLDIVYEDNDIAVINKPQGMVVHPAPGAYNHTLVNALLYHFDNISEGTSPLRPGIVHRIDKDTSGLLVVAKNNNAHTSLAAQIAEHTAFRHYIALLEGELKTEQGTITTKIARNPSDRKKMAVTTEGKTAITHYKILQLYKGYTLAEFVLETGRTHQIRVHSKYIGHPIVGDKTYGYEKQKFNLEGQLLHAYMLELTHPTTGERMKFTSELPDYFLSILKKLKKI